MIEIKRYGVNFVKQDDDCHAIVVMSEQLKGEWVRWEDVERLLRGRDTLMKMVEGMIKEKLESDKTQHTKLESDKTQDTGHK